MSTISRIPDPEQALWRAFEQALQSCGVSNDQFRRAVARTEAKHGKMVRGAVDKYALDTLARALAELTQNRALGWRLGLSMGRGSTGVVEYALLTAPSLREAHAVYERLGALVQESVAYEIVEEAGYGLIRMRPPRELPLHFLLEDYRVMRLLTAVRRALGEPAYVPTALHFTSLVPEPAHLESLRGLVGSGAELCFGQPHAGLKLPASELDRPLSEADPPLHEILLQSAEQLLEQAPGPRGLAMRVHQTLTATLHRGRPAAAEVARSLGLGERTLRRRLSEEGTTFAEVLDDVRRRMLQVLREDPEISAKQTAARLGFQSVRALRRAEQRWRNGS